MKPEVLVKAFVVHQSEDGFRELVASTVDEVYSRARRIVPGSPHLVEETVLRVYWELARKAPRLGEDVVLATWLREHTCKTAVKVLREEGRSVDRAALKKEKRGLATPSGLQAAPPGLATRVSQSILLNAARSKSIWLRLPRISRPAWIRPSHLGAAGAVCVLGIMALWNMPLHKRNPIVQSPGLLLTPAAFGQRANSEEGGAAPPPSQTPNTNAESNPHQP
jgi:hypothetical protein